MEAVLSALNKLNLMGIPISKIAAALVVLTVTQVLKNFVVGVIVKTIKRLTRKTETTLDDELILVMEPAFSWLIQIGGFWIVKQIFADELSAELSKTIGQTLNFIVVFIVAYVVYRSSSILGRLLGSVLLGSDTELDELLRPLMPKIFQSASIIILGIKVSELFLGQSAAALAGLLGGAGLTLGLLFKDVVYDWFCTIIIYSDNLYREGDWVAVQGINGFVQIVSIGFRSTTLHLCLWGSIVKMPNSKMISGIVENWSQDAGEELKWGINLTLKIDGISAQQTTRICNAIQEFPKSFLGLSESFMVRFSGIEDNARVIKIVAFVNDTNLYNDIERGLNIAILELLEKEGIDALYVRLENTPEKYKQSLQAANN
ncbi:MAG: mechanosensitive ion channel domain-containing protein [Cyanobacteria bacterium J06633_8]